MSNIDLDDFIADAAKTIENEYRRIQRTAKSDPGTAGDQGEENWATLLRDWLPATFHVETKGRILDSNGVLSPQIDILVLKPEYPEILLKKKHFLAGGVLAAFECKITLKAIHISSFFKTTAIIKNMAPLKGYRSIYEEAHSPIYVGLLAQSHSFSKKDVTENIGNHIYKNDQKYVTKPIEMPDLFCISDACCWIGKKSLAPQTDIENVSDGHCISTEYWSEQRENPYMKNNIDSRIPIATALKTIMHRLSKGHEGLRSLALYFRNSMENMGGGFLRYWPIKDVFSNHNVKEFKEIGQHPNYSYPDDFKYL